MSSQLSCYNNPGFWSITMVVTRYAQVLVVFLIATNSFAFRTHVRSPPSTARQSQQSRSGLLSTIPNNQHPWTALEFQRRTTARSFTGSLHSRQKRSSRTILSSFLPPGGSGNNNNSVSQLLTTVFGVALVVAFLASPLGTIFFAVFNSLLLLSILIPVFGWAAFQFWQIFFTISGACPNCGAPVRVAKDETPSFCFTCGSVIQARDDHICLANLNNNRLFSEQDEQEPYSVFSSFFGNMSGIQRRPSRSGSINGETSASTTTPTATKKSSSTTTIIDVDVERDD